MIIRKLLSSVTTLLLGAAIVMIIFSKEETNIDIIMNDYKETVLAMTVYIFAYVFPVSILIEKICDKIPSVRILFSFVLYVFFSGILIFVFWYFILVAIPTAILFMVIDETYRLIGRKMSDGNSVKSS